MAHEHLGLFPPEIDLGSGTTVLFAHCLYGMKPTHLACDQEGIFIGD